MGRIKPPSGAIFNRALKPEAQFRWKDAVQQENYGFTLGQVGEVLKLTKDIYEHPVTRDAGGAITSGIRALSEEIGDTDPLLSEAELREAAESRVAKTPPSRTAGAPTADPPTSTPTAVTPTPAVVAEPAPTPAAVTPTAVTPTPTVVAEPTPTVATPTPTPAVVETPKVVEGNPEEVVSQVKAVLDEAHSNVRSSTGSGRPEEELTQLKNAALTAILATGEKVEGRIDAAGNVNSIPPDVIAAINEDLKSLDQALSIYYQETGGQQPSPTRKRPTGTGEGFASLDQYDDDSLLETIVREQREQMLLGSQFPIDRENNLKDLLGEAARRRLPEPVPPPPVSVPKRREPVVTPPPGQEGRSGWRQVGGQIASTDAVPVEDLVTDALQDPAVDEAPWDWVEVGETVRSLYDLVASEEAIYSSLGTDLERYLDELIPAGIHTLDSDEIQALPAKTQTKLKGLLTVIRSTAPAPAAPAPTPEAAPETTPRKAPEPFTKKQQKYVARLLQTQAGWNANDALDIVKRIPGLTDIILKEPDERKHPELVLDILTLTGMSVSRAIAPKAKPAKRRRPKLADYRLERGDTVGVAKSKIAAMANVRNEDGSYAFTELDVANLLKDGMHRLQRVDETGGWAAQGGYYIDPTAVSLELAEVMPKIRRGSVTSDYKRRILALKEGREPYKRGLAAAKTAKTLGETAPEKAKMAKTEAARRKLEEQTRWTIAKVHQLKNKINFSHQPEVYNDWLKSAEALLDISKELRKGTGTSKGRPGTKIDEAELRRFRKLVSDGSGSTFKFTTSYLDKADRQLAKADETIERVKTDQEFLANLDEEGIAELYGSDRAAYLRDVRKSQSGKTDEVVNSLQERKENIKRKRRNVAIVGRAVNVNKTKLHGVLADPAKDKAAKLKSLNEYNKELEDWNNYLNRVLAGEEGE